MRNDANRIAGKGLGDLGGERTKKRGGGGGERERERERQTDRQTDRQTERAFINSTIII